MPYSGPGYTTCTMQHNEPSSFAAPPGSAAVIPFIERMHNEGAKSDALPNWALAEALIAKVWGTMDMDSENSALVATAIDRLRETDEVASWGQAVLTALNVGDVKSGSLLHLKLREVMIAYRASMPEQPNDPS